MALNEGDLSAPKDGLFYKNVFESLEDYCVFTTNMDGYVTSWNRGAQNILGYTEEEIIGQNADLFYIQEDVKTGKPELELIIAKEEGRAINERWHVKKDQSRFWGSGIVFPLKGENDELQGFVKVMRDQTLQVQLTRALENERTKLEKIFEQAPGFLVVLRGPEFLFDKVNEAFLQLSGRREVTGKPLIEVIPGLQGQEVLQQLSQVMATGKTFSGKEVKLSFYASTTMVGIEVYLNLTYIPDRDADGNIIGVIVHGYEVTDQVIARQVLLDAADAQSVIQQQKEEFIGIASHELKTPVTSLKAYSQFVEGTLRKDGLVMQANIVGKMSVQIEKLQNLITDLLDVTKVNGGKLQFKDEWFDFDQMLSEVVEELQRTTATHQISTHFQPIGKVWADKFRIGQVVTNLVTNAIKYSPNAKEVVVSCSLQQGEVLVYVQDAGIGIAAEHQEHLFNRFYRVSGSQENVFSGLGLGLYISAEIIRQQGGRIWVESEAGKGSTFWFALPVNRTTNTLAQ